MLPPMKQNPDPTDPTLPAVTTDSAVSVTTSVPAPAERGPQTTVEPIPDPCLIDGERVSDYVLVDFPENEGTTEWGFFPCSRPPADPVATTVAETVAPVDPPTLPATGPAETALATFGVGTVCLLLGVAATRIAKGWNG